MIGVLKKIWDFAGEEQGNIRKSMILGFFYAVFHMFQIAAIYVVVLALVGGSTDSAPAWQALGLLLTSILGRAVLNRFSQLQQTHAGYFMVANKRISIGDKLKRVPMGYFNDQSLGELTGITTTVLDEVESTGPMVLVGILGGLINSAVMLLCVLFWDWRIGLLALVGMLVYLALLSAMEKQSAKIAPKRQRDEARLVEAVLEQFQGMSVIKSFNLTGKGDKRVRQALEDSRANNLAVEKLFTPYIWGQEMVLHLFSVLILAVSVGLCLTGAMSLANALMAVIVSFLIFSQIQSAGSGVSALRLVGSSIDHANQVDDFPEMDQPRDCIRPCELLLWKPPHPQGCVTDYPRPDHHRHCGAFRLRQDHPLQSDRPVLGCGRRLCDHRRPGCAGVHAGVPHGAGEHGVPAGVPLCRHCGEQHQVRLPGRYP